MKTKTKAKLLKEVDAILQQIRESIAADIDNQGMDYISNDPYFLIESSVEIVKCYSEDV